MDLAFNELGTSFFMGDWEAIIFSHNQTSELQTLNISNNNIAGDLPFMFMPSFENIQNLNAGHNAISGRLNITTWVLKRQKYNIVNASSHPFQQILCFVDNNILDIIPSVQDLESTIDVNRFIKAFRDSEGGLLLGGNPFCSNAKSLLHKFLCRYSITDTSYVSRKKKASRLPIFIGVPVGLSIFAAGCILFASIWRLRKQVNILREFQLELLNRKVQPPFFSYQDLKAATKDFNKANKLGSGAFGAVYKGVLQDGQEVAVKRLFNPEGQVHTIVLNDFLNEVVLLTGIKHKNLVQLLGCCINDKERILVYEYAARGNVADALWGQSAQELAPMLRWRERLHLCVGVAWGLAYLHKELQPGIIHQDIKAANVLIDDSLNAKIADFGLAKLFREEETHAQFTILAGTRGYLAPEYALDGLLSDKADVYSFGILVLEVVSGRKCIDPTQPEDMVSLKHWAEILQKQGTLQNLLPPELKESCPLDEVTKVIDIALLCVDREPELRPSMAQVAIMLTGTFDETTLASLKAKKCSSDDARALKYGRKRGDNPGPEGFSLLSWAVERFSFVGKSEGSRDNSIEEQAFLHWGIENMQSSQPSVSSSG